MLLNVAKCQGYSFYRFWVITGKPIGGVKLHPTQIRVKKKKTNHETPTPTSIGLDLILRQDI